MSCRDIGNSTSVVDLMRPAISSRKPATRSCAVLMSSKMWSCIRCNSRPVVAHFKAEDVTGHIKLPDLAAAIVQDLGGADGPADELVEIFGRLVLAVDL